MCINHYSAVKRTLFLSCAVLMLSACAPAAQSTPPSLPVSQSAPSSVTAPTDANKIPYDYTEDYTRFEGAAGADGNKLVGLVDRSGKVILPADYKAISVAENKLIIAQAVVMDKDVFRVFTADGTQVGRDYNWIECASPGEDGVWLYREASFDGIPPVPPYVAWIEDTAGKRSYWLLDENGKEQDSKPYNDIEIYDDSIAMARDGYVYSRASDGTVTTRGNEVIETYFDGKYQVKDYYPVTHVMYLSLLDRDGKEIAPAKYSSIWVPFEDRYILCTGDRQYMGGERACLYDDTNKLLADNSNGYNFTVNPDGSYVGVSFVGSNYEDLSAYDIPQVMGADGKPEPAGAYFVDKDGKRLSERYMAIEGYENDTALQDTVDAGQYATYITRYSEDGEFKGIIDKAASGKTDPNEAFFLVLTTDEKILKIPYRDKFIK